MINRTATGLKTPTTHQMQSPHQRVVSEEIQWPSEKLQHKTMTERGKSSWITSFCLALSFALFILLFRTRAFPILNYFGDGRASTIQYFGVGFENHTRELTRWEAARFRGDVIKVYNQPPLQSKTGENSPSEKGHMSPVKEILRGGAALDLPGFRLNVIVPERIQEAKVSRLNGRASAVTAGSTSTPRRRLSSSSSSSSSSLSSSPFSTARDKVVWKQQGKGLTSPSNGTDILSHPTQVIKCHNQTMCIQPALQLNRVFNVYYCKHIGYGVRFYYLVREGLLLHPNINLVSDPYQSDMIVYLPVSADWDKVRFSLFQLIFIFDIIFDIIFDNVFLLAIITHHLPQIS